MLRILQKPATQHPNGLAYLLRALDFHTTGAKEVALVAPEDGGVEAAAELIGTARSRFRPNMVLAAGVEGTSSPLLLADRPAIGGNPAAYVCERFVCKTPVTDPAELEALLGTLAT